MPHSIPKSLRLIRHTIHLSVAALLLCGLSLFGGLHAFGRIGVKDARVALFHEQGGNPDGSVLHALPAIMDAGAPGMPVLHKGEQGRTTTGHFPHAAGIAASSVLLHTRRDEIILQREQARLADFTPVQLLMLYPHHGFW